MLDITGVSLHALCVALRWSTMFGGMPNNVQQWTREDNDIVKAVAQECDKRHRRGGLLVKSIRYNP